MTSAIEFAAKVIIYFQTLQPLIQEIVLFYFTLQTKLTLQKIRVLEYKSININRTNYEIYYFSSSDCIGDILFC
jgi:hypothetical protein